MFRLQIDRVFQKTGFGIIVTGTVIGGGVKVGSQISILPMNQTGKVRGLQSHGKEVEFVSTGDRAAINISGIDYSHVWRGAEIVSPNSMNQTTRMIANIHLIKSTHWKIKAEQRIRIHVGTSDIIGKIIFIPKKISAGESINVIMKLEKPISIAMDDRFIIRSYSPTDTIGGGIILDQHPIGSWTTQKGLCEMLSLNIQERFLQFVNATTKSPFSTKEWSKKFSKSEEYITKLIEQNRLKFENGFVFSQESQSKCQREVIDLLSRFHKDHPYRDRLNLESARSELGYSRSWFDFMLSQMGDKDVSVKNGGVALKSFKMEIHPNDMEDLKRIKNMFLLKKFLPVSVNEIGVNTQFDSNKILEFLHVLKRNGETINISDQFWMSMSDWNLLNKKLKTFYKSNDILSVSDFKSITDLSRKTAIPLLEYLDKIGITIRKGNDRLKGTNFSTMLNH
jgi:selenocysteine-specific elongation factor